MLLLLGVKTLSFDLILYTLTPATTKFLYSEKVGIDLNTKHEYLFWKSVPQNEW